MQKTAQIIAAVGLLALCAACSHDQAASALSHTAAGVAEGACRSSSDCSTNGRMKMEYPNQFDFRPSAPRAR